jgi:predicted small secreted protein
MKLLFIVLVAAAAIFVAGCNNNSAGESAAVKSVDSATAAAPDTIKAVVVDTAVKAPAKRDSL